jgi:hypothetical protein
MSKPRAYIIDTTDPRHVVLRGALRNYLRENGIPAMWSPSVRGWHLRRDRLADVVARLEHDGWDVRGWRQ